MSADLINEFLIIYRGYSGPELVAEVATLKTWLSTPYDAQTQGSKSYQKNRSEIVSRLAAIQRLYNERSGVPCIGVMDASGGIWPGNGTGAGAGANGFPDNWS